MKTNIIYDKKTKRVLVMQVGNQWVMPATMDLISYDEDPILVDVDGEVYLGDPLGYEH